MPKPKKCVAEVTAMRISHSGGWRNAAGRLIIELPKGISVPEYGETYFMDGVFLEPPGALCEGGFDYRRFLLCRGIRKIFHPLRVEHLAEKPPLHVALVAALLAFRDSVMDRMTEGMAADNRRIAAAMIFGCREGLNYKSRRTFLRSGVIHLFAVSSIILLSQC